MNKLPKHNIIFLILVSVGILSLWLAIKSEPAKIQSVIQKVVPSSSPTPSATPTTRPVPKKPSSTSTPSPQSSPITTSTPEPSSSPEPNKLQVDLSINEDSPFSISLEDGSNQCDVLSKALEEGKISNLNMRYDQTYQTYAVYQINGIGKENAVWWVFAVNGQSPTKGCSHIKVNDKDKIEWKYLGS